MKDNNEQDQNQFPKSQLNGDQWNANQNQPNSNADALNSSAVELSNSEDTAQMDGEITNPFASASSSPINQGFANQANSSSQSTTNNPISAQSIYGQPQTTSAGSSNPYNQQFNTISSAPHKSSIKMPLIAAAAILVTILLGFTIWYFAYFNNKMVVIRSALYSLMDDKSDKADISLKAKSDSGSQSFTGSGTIDYDKDGRFSGNVKAKAKPQDSDIDLGKVSFASDQKTLYYKLELSQMLKSLVTSGANVSLPSYLSGDQWIKLDLSTVINRASEKDSQSSDKLNQCLTKARDGLSDKSYKREIVDALLDTKFMTVEKSGSDNDGQIYSVALHGDKYVDFQSKFRNTKYFASVNGCIKNSGLEVKEDQSQTDSYNKQVAEGITNAKPELKLWIKGWNRQVNRLTTDFQTRSGSNMVNINLDMKFHHTKPSIGIPSNAKDIKDLQTSSSSNTSTGNSLLNISSDNSSAANNDSGNSSTTTNSESGSSSYYSDDAVRATVVNQ